MQDFCEMDVVSSLKLFLKNPHQFGENEKRVMKPTAM